MILGNINGEDIASVNVSPGELFSHPPNAIWAEGSEESSTEEHDEPQAVKFLSRNLIS